MSRWHLPLRKDPMAAWQRERRNTSHRRSLGAKMGKRPFVLTAARAASGVEMPGKGAIPPGRPRTTPDPIIQRPRADSGEKHGPGRRRIGEGHAPKEWVVSPSRSL